MPRLFTMLALTLLLNGCARSLRVQVVDRESGKPIADAHVAHIYVKKPYFITGCLVVDRHVSSADGWVTLKDRVGAIRVNASGYPRVNVAGEFGDSVAIEISREVQSQEAK